MSLVKGKLKAAREAIGKKDYPAAQKSALQALEYEPDNYHANVFLGLALLELNELEESEKVYRDAIAASPEQILAWQGICKLYERKADWDKYAETLRKLMDFFAAGGDPTKCAETLQKFIEVRREHGSRSQVVEALALLLHDSPLYPVLSTLPPPDPTNPTGTTTYATQMMMQNSLPVLEEIVASVEQDEETQFSKEFDKRRTRLGAKGPEHVRKEVGREIWAASKLPGLYDSVLNHEYTSNELRRATDAKLLRYKQKYLLALELGSTVKAQIATEVQNLVNGAVILGIPDELAWTIFLESRDSESIEGYGMDIMQRFTKLFPGTPMASLLTNYFNHMGIVSTVDADDDSEDMETQEDPFDGILDAFTALQDSIIAHRIVADVYLSEFDYQNTIRVSESGLQLTEKMVADLGKDMPLTRKTINMVLGTSLVHFFPPKHHARATRIIDEVLLHDSNNIACLMGRAYILQAANKWEEAGRLFAKVNTLVPNDPNEGLRAREEHAWCIARAGNSRAGIVQLSEVITILDELEERDSDRARCLWRLGRCHWDLGVEDRDEAYRFFITALKRDSVYAPAFTSLGVYYAEHVSPADPTRASKCFQKAFELDAREADAARRLAEGFAEEREWDLVEVVARRTIDGEGGLTAGVQGEGGGSRYLPTNAWAWKAVGVVELTRRNYPPAIQAFQIALRATPEDHVCWLRLGEAYSHAGRHVAALKALDHAHALDPNDWITSYFIGEVQRQTGHFQSAIDAFKHILKDRTNEVGILMSLSRAYLELGRDEFGDGFVTRAEQSFVASIKTALTTLEQTAGYRGMVWKIIADATFELSRRTVFIDVDAVRDVLVLIKGIVSEQRSEHLSGITMTSIDALTDDPDSSINGACALELALSAYDYRLALGLGSSETTTNGSAWFDVGVALNIWLQKKESTEIDKVIHCFTSALRQEPGNDIYWNALGNAYFPTHPKLAQHAFIKSLEIDNKNVITWTNIGLFYLHHDDLELANEALYRAQTLNADFTTAWIGQALVATRNGHDVDSAALLEHAVSLAADIPEGDLEFANRSFAQTRISRQKYSNQDHTLVDSLLSQFFSLDRYCRHRPTDPSALHLFSLVCESLGHMELAVDLIRRAMNILESAYEETEDPILERRFTIANSNLARLLLTTGKFEDAIEVFESVLGLLGDDDAPVNTELAVMKCQALFGTGLAHFKLGNLDAALDSLQSAMDSSGEATANGHVTVLLAQTLWAIGTDEARESAKAHLLECISADSENLIAINTLAGMGILTGDDSLVDAALSEILAQPLERRHTMDPRRDVEYMLVRHQLEQGNLSQAICIAESAVSAEPDRSDLRGSLASLKLQQHEFIAARDVLGPSVPEEDLGPARDILGLRAVVLALNDEPLEPNIDKSDLEAEQDTTLNFGKALQCAQRAVMLSPAVVKNWETLAFVRSVEKE